MNTEANKGPTLIEIAEAFLAREMKTNEMLAEIRHEIAKSIKAIDDYHDKVNAELRGLNHG